MVLTTNSLNAKHSLKTITLNEQNNYRLIEIGKIKYYFNQEIQYQQNLTSKLSKYLICLDYLDKISIVFLTVFSGTNIFTHVKGKKLLLGLFSSVFSLVSSLSSGIIKKLHQETKLRKKKHNKFLYLAKNSLDCVQILISNSIKDGVIDHNESLTILKDYDCLKGENKLSGVEIV